MTISYPNSKHHENHAVKANAISLKDANKLDPNVMPGNKAITFTIGHTPHRKGDVSSSRIVLTLSYYVTDVACVYDNATSMTLVTSTSDNVVNDVPGLSPVSDTLLSID